MWNDSPIYIDLYVARPKVICIEQHIIAFDQNHHNTISSYGTKINPNLGRNRTFVCDMGSDYYHKYPFGTVHYLITLMGKEGVNVEMPDLAKNYSISAPNGSGISVTTNAGQIILRADGAFKKVTDDNGQLLSKVKTYRDVVGGIVGMNLTIPEYFIIHKGQYAVQFCKSGYDMKVLSASNLYSYAFIFGPHPKFPNFSFTLDMD